MKTKILYTLPFAILLVACGDDSGGQEVWQAAVADLLQIVVVIATPILLILARKLVQVLEKKTGIDLAERQEAMLESWLLKGVEYAEEQGLKALKEGKPLAGSDKHHAAVDFVANALEATGAVEMGRDKLAQMVEARLNRKRNEDAMRVRGL